MRLHIFAEQLRFRERVCTYFEECVFYVICITRYSVNYLISVFVLIYFPTFVIYITPSSCFGVGAIHIVIQAGPEQ